MASGILGGMYLFRDSLHAAPKVSLGIHCGVRTASEQVGTQLSVTDGLHNADTLHATLSEGAAVSSTITEYAVPFLDRFRATLNEDAFPGLTPARAILIGATLAAQLGAIQQARALRALL